MLHGFEDKSATAVCTFAFSQGPGHEPLIFQGEVEVCLMNTEKQLIRQDSNVLTHFLLQGKIVAPRGGGKFGISTYIPNIVACEADKR